MFLWNMIGALMLIPALSHFLLRTAADAPAPERKGHQTPQQDTPDTFSGSDAHKADRPVALRSVTNE
ncbi:hypothetical protein D3C72_2594180 [compost metagenome]